MKQTLSWKASGMSMLAGIEAAVPKLSPEELAELEEFVRAERKKAGPPVSRSVLDTLLSAADRQAGIHSLLTLNARDFRVFGGFSFILHCCSLEAAVTNKAVRRILEGGDEAFLKRELRYNLQ